MVSDAQSEYAAERKSALELPVLHVDAYSAQKKLGGGGDALTQTPPPSRDACGQWIVAALSPVAARPRWYWRHARVSAEAPEPGVPGAIIATDEPQSAYGTPLLGTEHTLS